MKTYTVSMMPLFSKDVTAAKPSAVLPIIAPLIVKPWFKSVARSNTKYPKYITGKVAKACASVLTGIGSRFCFSIISLCESKTSPGIIGLNFAIKQIYHTGDL